MVAGDGGDGVSTAAGGGTRVRGVPTDESARGVPGEDRVASLTGVRARRGANGLQVVQLTTRGQQIIGSLRVPRSLFA